MLCGHVVIPSTVLFTFSDEIGHLALIKVANDFVHLVLYKQPSALTNYRPDQPVLAMCSVIEFIDFMLKAPETWSEMNPGSETMQWFT